MSELPVEDAAEALSTQTRLVVLVLHYQKKGIPYYYFYPPSSHWDPIFLKK